MTGGNDENVKPQPTAAPAAHTDAWSLRPYFAEFSGTAQVGSPANATEADWEHGRVVDALQTELVKLGHAPRKNQDIDLCLVDSTGKPSVLFEVKTESARYPIYTAIGQLQFHSRDAGPKRVIVLPDVPDATAISALERLGIRLITYSRTGRIEIDLNDLVQTLK